MYEKIYIQYLKKYTKFDTNILNMDIEYKNIWNYISIKWNYCLNSMNKNVDYDLSKSIICDLPKEKFYEKIVDFINESEECNIMKVKFTAACISKYL